MALQGYSRFYSILVTMTSFAVIVCQKATKRGLDYWCNHLRPRVIYLLKDVQRIDFRALGHLPLYLDSRIGYFRWPILVLPRGDVDPVSLPSQVLGEADVCMFNPQMLIFPVGALFKDMQACLCHIPLTPFDAGGGEAQYITFGSWEGPVKKNIFWFSLCGVLPRARDQQNM